MVPAVEVGKDIILCIVTEKPDVPGQVSSFQSMWETSVGGG